MSTQMIVVVVGGMVQEVYASDSNVEVVVADLDMAQVSAQPSDDAEFPLGRWAELSRPEMTVDPGLVSRIMLE